MAHKQVPLEVRLRKAPDSVFDQTHVIFGGTGAVGGQTALQMVDFYEQMLTTHSPSNNQFPSIVVTGRTKDEVLRFREKVKGRGIEAEGIFPGTRDIDSDRKIRRRELMTPSGVRIVLYEFDAEPRFPETEAASAADITKLIQSISSPFEAFLRDYITYERQVLANFVHPINDKDFRFASVVCGVPIPSVAAYRMKDLEEKCRARGMTDEEQIRALKSQLLKKIAQGFGNIRKELADEVLIAHTTGVGGMYDINQDGSTTIRLGFAHSAIDQALIKKREFAEELNTAYSEERVKVLITAAAIGINDVHRGRKIPYNGVVLQALTEADNIPKNLLTASRNVRVFPSKVIEVGREAQDKLDFTKFLTSEGKLTETKGYELKVDFALFSGENGLFSVDNAIALYRVMKVASEAELGIPMVTTAMLGDDPNKPWFDKDGICYYTETENANLVFALLDSRELREQSVKPFALKALQALGSAKHQAELHTLGLYVLLHRLKQFRENKDALEPFIEQYDARERRLAREGDRGFSQSPSKTKIESSQIVELIEKNSGPLYLEDVVALGGISNEVIGPLQAEKDFAQLLNIRGRETLCKFLGIDYGRVRSDEKGPLSQALRSMASLIRNYVDSITSLGTPILYRESGKDMIMVGPYVAPLDIAVTHNNTIAQHVASQAQAIGVDPQALFNWHVTNNGFVDLRAEARINTAKRAELGLENKIKVYKTADEFREAAIAIAREETYFNSSGIIATIERIGGILESLAIADLSYGTHIGWKALFRRARDPESGMHVLVPGVVEAMRHYQEGLGKTTGTEALYPGRGYFPRPKIERRVQLSVKPELFTLGDK